MMIFQFRLLSDELEDFLLDVEVPHDMSLIDFHNFLQKELNYDPSMIASFFTSDAEWEKLREFTSVDMNINHDDMEYELCEECDSPKAMDCIKLDDVIVEKFDRLLYVFDHIGERQLYVELLRTLKAEDKVHYPRIVERAGVAPTQIQ